MTQHTVVTRFPPSPTGFMHVGTARTALFNWLYAKHHGGKMLFRIEDTDRARHNEAAVAALINAMKWLELDWDGEIVSQFSMRERHAEVAKQLLAKGAAYECYCTPEELEAMREKAKAEGSPVYYDRRWREPKQKPPEGVKPVIRIKAPTKKDNPDKDIMTVADEVQGPVSVSIEQLDDFIILRSDGTPTYMLSVVVDDHDMGVTHVIRGDDHLNNTFRQNLIYYGMDWTPPIYAHLPLILGPDGAKMSKRHGAASVEEYRDMGYLPEAMRNYLLRLGWGHGDAEIISTEQAKAWFDLDGVGKSPARFDFDKLNNLNAHYIKECSPQRLLELSAPFFTLPLTDVGRARITMGINELKSRSKTLKQFAEESAFYLKIVPFTFDEKATALIAEGRDILAQLKTAFEAAPDFTTDSIQTLCKDISEGKLAKAAMPLRAALTGTTVSPSIFEAAAILGKEEVLARLTAALT